MKIIFPTCREHLTGEDVDFIVSVLSSSHDETRFLTRLLTDENTRDLILDNHKLVDAVQDRPQCLKISCYLYFYLMVRDGLRHAGLNDRNIADYVAELLAEFSSADRVTRPLPRGALRTQYLVDMLEAIRSGNGQQRFFLRTHIGNFALFMTGLYPQRIQHRQERRGAPGLNYYEQLGCSSYDIASHLHLADELELADLLSRLSACFHKIRMALNDIRERLLFIEPPQPDTVAA